MASIRKSTVLSNTLFGPREDLTVQFAKSAQNSSIISRMAVVLKSPEDIERMRIAGRLASEVLDFITPHVRPGVTTGKLNDLCHEHMVKVQGTVPAPLNYAPPGYRPFPKSICTSVNHQVCHGVPGERVLKAGDILNVDVTVIKDGYHGDCSRMFYVGEPSIQAKRLVDVTFECMWLGIRQVRPGARLGDIGAAIQAHAEKSGFSVVREFCGHGIGRKFHEEPQVLHYGRAGAGLELEPGMTFTIEPMINAGKPGIRELADGWTIVTKDHSLSAQWEHTVAVTEAGFEVLTKSTGTQAAAMTADLRGEVAAGRQALRESYLRRPNPRALLTQHSQLIDRTVRKVWNEIATVRDAALVATGGYGRGELYPSSDIDLLVLLAKDPSEAEREALERLIGRFWDIGLEIGHSVRTVEGCIEAAASDITVRTTLLEARFLAGSRSLYRELTRRGAKLGGRGGVLQGEEARAGAAPCQAPGLALLARAEPEGSARRPARPSRDPVDRAGAAGSGNRWNDLVAQRLIERGEARQLARLEAHLQDLRIRLHYLAGRREDRIVFDLQTALAAQLGHKDTPSRRAQRGDDAALLPDRQSRHAAQYDPAAEPRGAPRAAARHAAAQPQRALRSAQRAAAHPPGKYLRAPADRDPRVLPADDAAPGAARHDGAHAARAVARPVAGEWKIQERPKRQSCCFCTSCSSRAASCTSSAA